MLRFSRLISAITLLMLALPASATTILYSGTLDESGGRNIPLGGADYVFRDFNTNVANPGLKLGGDLSIYGYVAHKAKSLNQWTDGWTLDFGAATYEVDFNWTRLSSVFNGSLTVGGSTYTLSDVAGGMFNLGPMTGVVTFDLDPTDGGYTGAERGTWVLNATQIAPIPLPASGVLLVFGLASLRSVRRAS